MVVRGSVAPTQRHFIQDLQLRGEASSRQGRCSASMSGLCAVLGQLGARVGQNGLSSCDLAIVASVPLREHPARGFSPGAGTEGLSEWGLEETGV